MTERVKVLLLIMLALMLASILIDMFGVTLL